MASDSTPTEGKKSADRSTDDQLQTSRRSVLGALGLAAIGKWNEDEVNLSDLEWPTNEIGGKGQWKTDEMEIEAATSFTLDVPGAGGIDTGRLVEPATVNVKYDDRGVDLDIQLERENVRNGIYLLGSAEEMRQLAIALFQAAEEKAVRDQNSGGEEP